MNKVNSDKEILYQTSSASQRETFNYDTNYEFPLYVCVFVCVCVFCVYFYVCLQSTMDASAKETIVCTGFKHKGKMCSTV